MAIGSVALAACSSPSTSPPPTTTIPSNQPAASTTTEAGQLVPDLIAPARTLDWSGFEIRPTSCQVTSPSLVEVTGSGTVPALAARGTIAGEIEAWAVERPGHVVPGKPAHFPEVAGIFTWTVAIPVASGSPVVQCKVQGINPAHPFAEPQP
jgi:hypothetical protein